MKTEQLVLIDLWFLDGNYNLPIKVKGFKHLVQESRWYEPREGYLYINPKNSAFVACNTIDTIFDNHEKAMFVYEKKKVEHKKYVVGQLEYYNKEMEKITL